MNQIPLTSFQSGEPESTRISQCPSLLFFLSVAESPLPTDLWYQLLNGFCHKHNRHNLHFPVPLLMSSTMPSSRRDLLSMSSCLTSSTPKIPHFLGVALLSGDSLQSLSPEGSGRGPSSGGNSERRDLIFGLGRKGFLLPAVSLAWGFLSPASSLHEGRQTLT